MKHFPGFINIIRFVLLICIISSGCTLVDDSPLEDWYGLELGEPKFASGPTYDNYYHFAEGLIDAAGESLGVLMDNVATFGSLQNARMLVSGGNYMGNAYMAMMQEDVFRYAQKTCETQFNSNPDSVDKELLRVASQLKVLLALFKEDVHLLVNTGSGINSVTSINSGHKVNVGPRESGTYITAKTILDAHGLDYSAQYDDPAAGVQEVVDGNYDAAFIVTAAPSLIFQGIPAGSNVKLIQVQMPAAKKYYNEDGTIRASDYPFQSTDVSANITVKTLLVGNRNFDDRNIGLLLDYIFDHIEEYKAFNYKWNDISLALSQEYMTANPQVCNYRAICYVSGFPELDPFYIDPYIYSGYGIGAYHDMTTELIWLLSHNMGIDLRERNSTGTWENSYRMLNGEATMALVQDDIFDYLVESNDMYESMQAASMKKVAPLHYEYLHLLVNNNQYGGGQLWREWYIDAETWGGASAQQYPYNLQDVFTDPAETNSSYPVLDINVGPKTSGTFITAMQVIDSYRTMNTRHDDNPDLPDMEHMEIHYHFDAPSDAVLKVESGEYHAAFVVTGVPYHRFYSHDTWDITDATNGIPNCELIPAQFYGSTPHPYREGTLHGNGAAVFENYPYPNEIHPNPTNTTVRVRALQVVSSVFNDSSIYTYIKSIFRKGYYKTYPADPDDGDFVPDPLWIAIKKESFSSGSADYDTYEEDVVGAKEYFVKYPFGWSNGAIKYYLSLFPDN